MISDLLVDLPQIPKLVETSKGLDQQVSENEGGWRDFQIELKKFKCNFFDFSRVCSITHWIGFEKTKMFLT